MKFELSEEHISSKNKQRNVIVRSDTLGDFVIHERDLTESDLLNYIFDILDNTENQVKTIFWDIMYGADFFAMYDSKIISGRHKFINKLGENTDFIGKVLSESKKRGYENFIVNRISEVIIDTPLPDMVIDHPEYFIRSWNTPGNFNLAYEEVRKYKTAVIEEVLRLYDFDGVDIDFLRHTPFLTPGKQWELRENVTDYLRELREMTLTLEKEKNKPILLSARVPESVFLANSDGIDIEKIAQEKLVDLLTLGSRSINVDVKSFRDIVGDDIKLYPCHDSEHASDGYMYPNMEITRGIFSSWWQMGADGVQTFNHHTQRDSEREEMLKKYNFEYLEPECFQERAYSEIGDYSKMQPLDKTFVIERKGGYPWGTGISYNNETKQLPAQMCNYGTPKQFYIYSSDDISTDSGKGAVLSLVFYGLCYGDEIEVFFDDEMLLPGKYDFNYKDPQIVAPNGPVISGGRVRDNIVNNTCVSALFKAECAVPNKSVTVGYHKIDVSVKREKPCRDRISYKVYPVTTVEKIELSVKNLRQNGG